MLTETANQMYRGYGTSSVAGIQYFKQFVAELNCYDFVEIITYFNQRYDYVYIRDFLLSTPEVWLDEPIETWLKILHKLSPRRDPICHPNFDGMFFFDVHFLAKYLRLDIFDYFAKSPEFSLSDKTYVIKYGLKYDYEMRLDSLDIEDMDGKYFISYTALKSMQKKFLENTQFSELPSSSKLKRHLQLKLNDIS